MSRRVFIEIELPEDLEQLKLPRGVDQHLQELLDRLPLSGKRQKDW